MHYFDRTLGSRQEAAAVAVAWGVDGYYCRVWLGVWCGRCSSGVSGVCGYVVESRRWVVCGPQPAYVHAYAQYRRIDECMHASLHAETETSNQCVARTLPQECMKPHYPVLRGAPAFLPLVGGGSSPVGFRRQQCVWGGFFESEICTILKYGPARTNLHLLEHDVVERSALSPQEEPPVDRQGTRPRKRRRLQLAVCCVGVWGVENCPALACLSRRARGSALAKKHTRSPFTKKTHTESLHAELDHPRGTV